MRIIKFALSNVIKYRKSDHTRLILEQPNLKMAHIYCLTNNVPGPLSGQLLEKYIAQKYHFKKHTKSLAGDIYCDNSDTYYEIKISLGGKYGNKFQYCQLRPHHNCDYLLTAYHLQQSNLSKEGELFVFKMDKTIMNRLIAKYGNYSRGSKKLHGPITEESLNDPDNINEYSLRIRYDSEPWKQLLDHRVDIFDT